MHKTPAQTKINKNNNEGQRFVLSCKLCVNYCVAQQHLNCMPCGENKSRKEILFDAIEK
jgi:hypothetical protein